MSGGSTPVNGTALAKGPGRCSFVPLVSVVDFHHARGPEVEKWFGAKEGRDPAVDYDWTLLPFMALSDGAHASTEDFSYFTLLRPATQTLPATSLFGISCTRQMDASQLLNRPPEVTRSTVQKAVVVIADSPQSFGVLRERLSVVTKAWFAQRDFTDTEILRRFQESLADEKERGLGEEEEDADQYLGMSLRELVHDFKWQTLVLLKCCLLQPKMLFFGSRCEHLCMIQFSLISLIPGLLRNLQDSAGPDLESYEKTLTPPTSLRTSDRASLLAYMGLPLRIFGKGSLFGPYTPLQQLDILADFGTKSYIVGSTNSLLLQQRDRYSDILINLDDETVNITSSSLRNALQLSVADRRWIDFLTQKVNDTWDKNNTGRPSTMGYVGSEEFIRLQFEEYLLAMIASVKYHNYLHKHGNNPRMTLPHIEGDPAHDFHLDWVEAWARTENYRIWDKSTDSHIFDIVEPRHPCAGGLTMDDVQRRITQQVQDLHLDERFAQGREVLGQHLAAGREKANTIFNRIYSDMESMREAQRRKAEEQKAVQSPQAEKNGAAPASYAPGVDLVKAQQTMQSVGVKAGAFVNSWAQWAGEKRKTAWGRASPPTLNGQAKETASQGSGGGWGASWGRTANKSRLSYQSGSGSTGEKDGGNTVASRRLSAASGRSGLTEDDERLLDGSTAYSESIFDAAGSESDFSSPMSPHYPRHLSGSTVAAVPVVDVVTVEPENSEEKCSKSPPLSGKSAKSPLSESVTVNQEGVEPTLVTRSADAADIDKAQEAVPQGGMEDTAAGEGKEEEAYVPHAKEEEGEVPVLLEKREITLPHKDMDGEKEHEDTGKEEEQPAPDRRSEELWTKRFDT